MATTHAVTHQTISYKNYNRILLLKFDEFQLSFVLHHSVNEDLDLIE